MQRAALAQRCFAEPGPRFLRVASNRGPGSAAHRFAKGYALRCVRGTKARNDGAHKNRLEKSPKRCRAACPPFIHHRHPEVLAVLHGEPRRMGHKRKRPSFETPRKRAAPLATTA